MKLLFLLALIGAIGIVVYLITVKIFTSSIKQKKKSYWKPLSITLGVVALLLGLFGYGLYMSAMQPDMQCSGTHSTTMQLPVDLTTATGYFAQGDYAYDIGNCRQAVIDYTKAIMLNPTYAQAYNNRAYTNMRLRNYRAALSDLDRALELKPDYIQALMNRGDIHNFYYQIDRLSAIKDYEKVVALEGTQKTTSVCGHLFLAKHNGWTLGAYFDYFTGGWNACK